MNDQSLIFAACARHDEVEAAVLVYVHPMSPPRRRRWLEGGVHHRQSHRRLSPASKSEWTVKIL